MEAGFKFVCLKMQVKGRHTELESSLFADCSFKAPLHQQLAQLAYCLQPPSEGDALVGPAGALEALPPRADTWLRGEGRWTWSLTWKLLKVQQKNLILLAPSTSAGNIFAEFPQKSF